MFRWNSRDWREDTQDDEFEIKYESIKSKQVRDYTHLGELLRGRERPKAALKEYQKASRLGGDGNPMIQNGVAESLIELKRFAEVPDSLKRVRSYYPDSLRIRLNLARAYAALGQSAEAISEFEKAIGINPFHPLIHLSLEKLYEKTENKDGMRRARETLELIQ